MSRFLLPIFLILGLASCGVDGAPIRPTASANISVGSSGTYASGRVGARRGPFSIFIGV